MRIEPTKATRLSRSGVGARPGVPLELSTLERPCVACCMYFCDQRFQLSTLTVAEGGCDLPRCGRMGGHVDGRPKEPTVDDFDLFEHCDVETMRADLHKAEELHHRTVKAHDARSDPHPCRFPHCRHHHGDPFLDDKAAGHRRTSNQRVDVHFPALSATMPNSLKSSDASHATLDAGHPRNRSDVVLGISTESVKSPLARSAARAPRDHEQRDCQDDRRRRYHEAAP